MSTQEKQKYRVLVVEDEIDLNALYTKKLERAGYEVYQALTLDEARELTTQNYFDVVLCDMRLGNKKGLDFLQEFQELLKVQGTQVLVISAEPQYRSFCENLGIEFFMVKPVALDTLALFVDRMIMSRQPTA